MEEDQRDFFISYNSADRQWAEWVAWQLEEQQFTVYIQAWDFLLGENFVLEMQEAVQQSRNTVAILSPDYLTSRFTQAEWAAAFAGDPEGKKSKLIPLRVRECQPPGLLEALIILDIIGLPEKQACELIYNAFRRFEPLQHLPLAGNANPITTARLKPLQPPPYPVHLGSTSLSPNDTPETAPPPNTLPTPNPIHHILSKSVLQKLGVVVVAALLLGSGVFFLLPTARKALTPLPQLGDKTGLWRKWQDGAALPVELDANKRLGVSPPQLVYASDWNYDDYELRFHLRLESDAGVAWVWRMEDETNYYLCVLAGPQTKAPGLYLYVVREGKFKPGQPEDQAPDHAAFFCHLRAPHEYEVRLSVKTQQEQGSKTDQIEVCLIPAYYEVDDASCQPTIGEPVILGTLRTKRVYFPSGSLGFRALASEQFSVSSVLVLAPH